MLGRLKEAGLRVARGLGAGRLVRDSQWRTERLLILCYHGISLQDEHRWSSLYVTEDLFRRRLRALKEGGFNVLPLDDAVSRLAAGTLPPRSVVITFDDGFYDFFALAYPVLLEFGFHATVYLATYYCFLPYPVFDPLVSYLMWRGPGRRIELPGLLDAAVTIPSDETARNALYAHIRTTAQTRKTDAEEKQRLARSLAGEVGVDFDALMARRVFQLMNPGEVGSLDGRLVSIQLHTHRHRTPRDRALFLREIADNRAAILKIRPKEGELRHFCYPSGVHDPVFLPWLEEAGVVSATTCDLQLVSRATHPLVMPRLLDSMHVSDTVFDGWLTGIAAFVPQRRS